MSSTVSSSITNPDTKNASNEALGQGQPARAARNQNYKGFVAGIFSGIAKLSGISNFLHDPIFGADFELQLGIRESAQINEGVT